VLPILLAEPVVFKVAASADVLGTLNSGERLSQVGKFITVYPRDNGQAVRLAVALDEATRGLCHYAFDDTRTAGEAQLPMTVYDLGRS
jgi:hypothetical protein